MPAPSPYAAVDDDELDALDDDDVRPPAPKRMMSSDSMTFSIHPPPMLTRVQVRIDCYRTSTVTREMNRDYRTPTQTDDTWTPSQDGTVMEEEALEEEPTRSNTTHTAFLAQKDCLRALALSRCCPHSLPVPETFVDRVVGSAIVLTWQCASCHQFSSWESQERVGAGRAWRYR